MNKRQPSRSLVDEREFLLRSLDDLDAELAAGELDRATYDELRADYTARAAALERQRREASAPEGSDAAASKALSLPRRLLVGGAIVLVAVVAAVVLTMSVGERSPGGTITGNDQVAAEAPSSVADPYLEHIGVARSLLQSDPLEALKEYDAAAQLDPSQPEPPTYIGWIYALTAQQVEGAEREELTANALASLESARAIDSDYPDAQAFTGLVMLNLSDDPERAAAHLQKFLLLAPDHPMADSVRAALARAVEASGTGTGTG